MNWFRIAPVVLMAATALLPATGATPDAAVAAPVAPGTIVGPLATGPASIIRSDFVSNGHRNFELVVLQGHDLVHYWKDNSDPGLAWHRGQVISSAATGPGSIAQSDFLSAGHGNLEVVVQEGSQVVHYWHDSAQPNGRWQRAGSFGTGVTGAPAFITSDFTSAGHRNFEVVVPEGSTLAHYWLDNSRAGSNWARAGEPAITGVTSGASLIQSDFGSPGNLELVVLGPRAPVPADSRVDGDVADYRLLHYWHDSANVGAAWGLAGDVAYRGRSEKVCQLTGKWDTERLAPTTNGAGGLAYDHWGTDLGYPIDDGTTLTLMFGDTHLNHTPIASDELVRDDDVVLQTTQTAPPIDTRCLQLGPVPGGTALTPADVTVGGATDPNFLQGFFNVPTSGFVANGTMYAAFWTNHCMAPDHCAYGSNPVGDGYLTRRLADPRKYDKLFKLPATFVYNTAVNAATVPGLPADQRLGVYLWGIPKYRESYPYLAYAPAATVADQSTWRYLTGLDANGAPVWSTDPAQANTVFTTGDAAPCIGESLVAWVEPLQKWLMLYNCQPGVVARTSNTPWGPWSAPSTVFSPNEDNGLCHFVHHGEQTCDRATDAPWSANGGGPYAPFVLSRYTSGTAGRATLYYLLSTWNPYQVLVMRMTLTS